MRVHTLVILHIRAVIRYPAAVQLHRTARLDHREVYRQPLILQLSKHSGLLVVHHRRIDFDHVHMPGAEAKEQSRRCQAITRTHFAHCFTLEIVACRHVLLHRTRDPAMPFDHALDRLREDRRLPLARFEPEEDGSLAARVAI